MISKTKKRVEISLPIEVLESLEYMSDYYGCRKSEMIEFLILNLSKKMTAAGVNEFLGGKGY